VTDLPLLRVIPDHDIFVMVNGLGTVEHPFKLARSVSILYFVFLTKRSLIKLVSISILSVLSPWPVFPSVICVFSTTITIIQLTNQKSNGALKAVKYTSTKSTTYL
jgi:hypothetical protein